MVKLESKLYLFKAFNPENEQIIFTWPTTYSNGNLLTPEEAQEFLKSSLPNGFTFSPGFKKVEVVSIQSHAAFKVIK